MSTLTRDAQLIKEQGPNAKHNESAVASGVLLDPAFPVPEHGLGGSANWQSPSENLASKQAAPLKQSTLHRWWGKVLQSQAVPPCPPSATATADQPLGLQARLKRRKESQARPAAQSLFDLAAINEQMSHLIQQQHTNCLELPRYTGKVQKREVKTLAALYGLEPRQCGRVGMTLFKTDRAGSPDQEQQSKVNTLLAKSTATQRPGTLPCGTHKKRNKAKSHRKMQKQLSSKGKTFPGGYVLLQTNDDAAQQTPSTTQVHAPPLDSSNIGSRMLVSMGWEAGTGLGSALQGQTEPIPIIKRRRHLGLGA